MTGQPASPPEEGTGDIAVQERRRRFSIVWIIPIVVILVGGW
jgi:paraquat-inducible protein B